MCTVVISLAPGDPVPLLLLGVRDEFTRRPWQRPARHWPGSPLIGGRDQLAGGTWLAVHPGIPRVACVLNGRGQAAAPARRRSRGELPLRAAVEGTQALKALHDDLDALTSYDPFHLVCADRATATLLSWDGRQAVHQDLTPGTHVLTNAGHTYPPPPGLETDPKAAYFGPRFAARRAWGDWRALAKGAGLPLTDPAAIIARRELPDGRIWGSTSVSLVALGTDGLRYDFQPIPGDPSTWYTVEIG